MGPLDPTVAGAAGDAVAAVVVDWVVVPLEGTVAEAGYKTRDLDPNTIT